MKEKNFLEKLFLLLRSFDSGRCFSASSYVVRRVPAIGFSCSMAGAGAALGIKGVLWLAAVFTAQITFAGELCQAVFGELELALADEAHFYVAHFFQQAAVLLYCMGTADTGFFHDGPDGELYPFFAPEGAVELKKYGHVDGCGDGPQLVQLPVQPEACQLGNEG